MSLAPVISRGRRLNERLGVNGIQKGSRSFGTVATLAMACASRYGGMPGRGHSALLPPTLKDAAVRDKRAFTHTTLPYPGRLLCRPCHERKVEKAAETQSAPAARAGRPRPRRDRGDAGDRVHRRARQIPARSGPAERGRILVQGRRRAVAVAALRPDRAAGALRR